MAASTLIMGKPITKLGADLGKQTYAFLEKLAEDDAAPGLHIEPIAQCRDARVRTGRVTLQYRAVLFRLDGPSQPAYVFVGVFNHDDAIKRARQSELSVNPVNGVTEVRFVAEAEAPADVSEDTTAAEGGAVPVLPFSAVELRELGLDDDLAERASRAASESELVDLASRAVEWQGLALLDLMTGVSPDEVREKLALQRRTDAPARGTASDAQILEGLRHPAAQLSYTYVEDNDELRRVIEQGDYGAWRVFLHPEQRAYAERSYRGPYRLTGGAGTGKTVVLVHRAANLARRDAGARILLTTFTTNLALELSASLRRLDPTVPQPGALGAAGVFVGGLDAVASAVLKASAAPVVGEARRRVLGSESGGILKRTDAVSGWQSAIDAVGQELPAALRTAAFFDAEYGEVVLPQRITEESAYLKVRRPGRGVRLNRGERSAVWRVVESYRLSARAAGSVDFREAAVLAATALDLRAEAGEARPLDHVLVDEGQDLAPAHWLLVRALVAPGEDDIFVAEDSHQRIYGRRITLKPYGINVVGRSRRLTLNYRTTAENLAFALRVLEPGSFRDLDDEPEATGYRSARRGPQVERHPAPGMAAELDFAAEVVGRWRDEAAAADQPADSIAILVRDRFLRDRVVNGLAERGVTVRPVDREAVPGGAPVVMTMHRAKGTEFRNVLLFGVGQNSIPKGLAEYDYTAEEAADAELRERSLLYVAATRARDQLAVSWSQSASRLLPAGGLIVSGSGVR